MAKLTGLVILVALLAVPALALAQDQSTFAQERFSRGVDLFENHQYEDALAQFRGSLGLYASPNTRRYVALCLVELGRIAEAVPELERAASEAADRARSDPRYAETQSVARAELRALEPRVGRLMLVVANVPDAAHVRVAGREVPAAALGMPLAVMPGRIEVTIEGDGIYPARGTVSVSAGQRASLTLALRRTPVVLSRRGAGSAGTGTDAARAAPTGMGLARTAGWITLGVGALGVASFGAFAAVTNDQYQALYRRCVGLPCPEGDRGAVSTGETMQLISNISLGIGVAGAIAGTLLVVINPGARAATRPDVQVGFTGTAMTLQGAF